MGSLQQIPVVVWSLLVGLLVLVLLVRHRHKGTRPSRFKTHVEKVNDSLDQPARQSGIPKMQVLFFHGIPSHDDFSDIHLTTWRHRDGFIWPQDWLAEDYPGIHVFFVKYSAGLVNENFHMNNIAENLVSDLLDANIGQVPGCPVVLVGHCIGGLVIKALCCKAHQQLHEQDSANDRTKKREFFLLGVKGVFFYSTPHHGIREIAKASHVQQSRVFKLFEPLSTRTAVLNESFNNVRNKYSKWKIHGVGESLQVKSGLFQNILVVEEASARDGAQIFQVLINEDHYSVCKPQGKKSGGFYCFTRLLDDISTEDITAQEESQPQNFQVLPKSLVGIEDQLQKLISEFDNNVTLGLTGMGGLGKTTLAKAIFNEVGCNFEYSCFIPEVKLEAGSVGILKKEFWKYMYKNGEQVVEGDWSQLTRKDLFLVLDDISDDRHLQFLQEIAERSSKKSRFLATSRRKDIFNTFDEVYEVSTLDENSAQELFMSYAFPKKETPSPKLGSLIIEIVKKCEGLPLTLEVLGQWLKGSRNEELWRQTLACLHHAEQVENFNERLWAKLMPSINGLEEKALQMFVDATLFFYENSWTLRDAQAAWREAYEVHEMPLWKTLVDRSLVYDVKEDEPIKVHEQLRSLGLKISSKSDKSQVLETSSAFSLILSKKESDKKTLHNIHALRLQFPGTEEMVIDALRSEKLAAAVANLEENHSQTLGSSEASASKNEEMDVLRASIEAATNLEEDTFVDGRVNISRLGLQKLEKLRYLDVSGFIVTGEDGVTNWLPSSLVVLRCDDIEALNLEHQRRLAVLKICRVKMRSLPNSIGQLTALRILVIKISHIESIPDEIGDLSNLEVLDINICPSVRSLPETLGKLSKLKILVLSWCFLLKTLPESLGNLCALERLEFDNCGFKTLPNSFRQLSALNDLRVKRCLNLECLPETFGHLRALSHLELVSCHELQSLPESLSQLGQLEYLDIRGCGKLDSLQNWQRSHSKALEKVNASDFQGALAGISAINVRVLPYGTRAFVLQERGILKRLAGDFGGALEDLTAALEINRDDYELLKHRAYVKYLLGDLDGARMDAETCSRKTVGYYIPSKHLAAASVAFLEFDLK